MTQKSLDAKEKAGNRPRSERRRYLNIIYFIDSKRTRTLKFSIKAGYLTVGTLGLLVSWSLVASLLLIREHGLNKELRSRSRNLLSVIFNYQTRYDQVYEKAYPTNEDHPMIAGPAGVEDRAPETPAAPSTVVPAPPATLAAKVIPTVQDSGPELDVPAPKEKVIANALDQLPDEPTIAIENFSSAVHDETLTIRFSLKNTNKGSKASGTVTAQARFFENGKEGIWLETLTDASEGSGDTGDQDDPSSDEHFNIRYYKNKVFHFTSPTKGAGLFTAVRITVKDEQGRSKEFPFPLTKEPRAQQTRLGSGTLDTDSNATAQ